ncbi:hypothetical protein Bbelb_061300 [Branchiostoma belcheri]|nr:hypothetical protein Bbelb_061300 [Branchiostoma belcheri]
MLKNPPHLSKRVEAHPRASAHKTTVLCLYKLCLTSRGLPITQNKQNSTHLTSSFSVQVVQISSAAGSTLSFPSHRSQVPILHLGGLVSSLSWLGRVLFGATLDVLDARTRFADGKSPSLRGSLARGRRFSSRAGQTPQAGSTPRSGNLDRWAKGSWPVPKENG